MNIFKRKPKDSIGPERAIQGVPQEPNREWIAETARAFFEEMLCDGRGCTPDNVAACVDAAFTMFHLIYDRMER